jgi:hypothetical protein
VGHLIELGRRLAELEVRTKEGDDARRILAALGAYNGLADLVAPDLALPGDNDLEVLSEEMKP